MSVQKSLWAQLRRGKSYREEFVTQVSRQAIPLQIAALMKQYDLNQSQLAKRSGLTQGVISRAVDPSYGKLTLRTLARIAAGFDVAFLGLFVPFSELPRWFDRLEQNDFAVTSFEQEDTQMQEEAELASAMKDLRETIVDPWLKFQQQLANVTIVATVQRREQLTVAREALLARLTHESETGAKVIDLAQFKAQQEAQATAAKPTSTIMPRMTTDYGNPIADNFLANEVVLNGGSAGIPISAN